MLDSGQELSTEQPAAQLRDEKSWMLGYLRYAASYLSGRPSLALNSVKTVPLTYLAAFSVYQKSSEDEQPATYQTTSGARRGRKDSRCDA
jgi:hypothetical protein